MLDRWRRLPLSARAAALYAFFGGFWIIASDATLQALVKDVHAMTRYQTYKGWLFVAASSLLIWSFLRRELRVQARILAELRDSRDRFRTLFNDSPASLLHADLSRVKARLEKLRVAGATDLRRHLAAHPDDVRECAEAVHLRDANSAFLAASGFRDLDKLRVGLPDQLADGWRDVMLDVLEAVFEGRTSLEVERQVVRLDGEERTIIVHWAVTPRHEATYDSVFSAHLDVTEQRRALEEARQHLLELAHATRVLSLGELTSSLTHELSQPLAAILANTQAAGTLLARERPDIEEARRALADVEAANRRATDIIGNVRGLLRRGGTVPEQLDLHALAGDVLRLLREEARRRRVLLVLEPAGELPPVTADRVHIQQVIVNLVLNAFDALAAVPPPRRRVTVRVSREGAEGIAVTVHDTGPGIAPEMSARLFEPFATTKAGGLGLGLSICRRIVETHGGRLEAASRDTGGTAFTFRLPVAREGAA